MDLNGDNKLDIIQKVWWSASNIQQGAWINNGTSWQYETDFVPPFYITANGGYGAQDNGVRLVDLNGDGLLDAIQKVWWSASNIQQGAWINNGTSWQYEADFVPPFYITVDGGYGARDNGVRLVDLNGDGLLDAIQKAWWSASNIQKGAWINNGTVWQYEADLVPPFYITANGGYGAQDNGVRMLDMNNDGFIDIIQKVWWSSSNIQKGTWSNFYNYFMFGYMYK